MKTNIRVLCIVAIVVLAGLDDVAVVRLLGQGATATIQGTVTDSSGAAIPRASVQAKNVGTGTTQSTTSNAQGRFNVADLDAGEYEVETSKMSFSTVVHKGITLTVGAQSVVDFALPVGQARRTLSICRNSLFDFKIACPNNS